jgi:hypothetical protein
MFVKFIGHIHWENAHKDKLTTDLHFSWLTAFFAQDTLYLTSMRNTTLQTRHPADENQLSWTPKRIVEKITLKECVKTRLWGKLGKIPRRCQNAVPHIRRSSKFYT